MQLVGAPGEELVVFGEHQAMPKTAVDPLRCLREGALRARYSYGFEGVGHVRVDAELSFVVHSPCVHVASGGEGDGEVLTHLDVINKCT